MTELKRIETEYLSHEIYVQAGPVLDSSFVGLYAMARIGKEGIEVCRLQELLDSAIQTTSADWPNDDSDASVKLAERALHRARGLLLEDRVQEARDGRFVVPATMTPAVRSEEYIRRLILQIFKRVYKANPWQGGAVNFDDIGVALVEGVDPKEIEYGLSRLSDAGLIKPAWAGHEPGSRGYEPTPRGLEEADRLQFPERAPWNLVEEALVVADSFLSKHAPNVVESLRRQATRVAVAPALTEHEVGEVAQACEQVIWDFLDIDALWAGVTEPRPAKDKTRERVRILTMAKVGSETNRDLAEGLMDYVVGWFGPLEQYVHKHRHLPGQGERRDGRRCVTYTYLFMADLLELLGL